KRGKPVSEIISPEKFATRIEQNVATYAKRKTAAGELATTLTQKDIAKATETSKVRGEKQEKTVTYLQQKGDALSRQQEVFLKSKLEPYNQAVIDYKLNPSEEKYDKLMSEYKSIETTSNTLKKKFSDFNKQVTKANVSAEVLAKDYYLDVLKPTQLIEHQQYPLSAKGKGFWETPQYKETIVKTTQKEFKDIQKAIDVASAKVPPLFILGQGLKRAVKGAEPLVGGIRTVGYAAGELGKIPQYKENVIGKTKTEFKDIQKKIDIATALAPPQLFRLGQGIKGAAQVIEPVIGGIRTVGYAAGGLTEKYVLPKIKPLESKLKEGFLNYPTFRSITTDTGKKDFFGKPITETKWVRSVGQL
ncbi:MAG TPA: hypothetical protein VMW25_02180, partial [Clostridia bacterium]|nr:hypothetical protein [Clostridia bacterium]